MLATVGRAGDVQLAVLLLDADVARLALEEIAAGAGHADDLGLDRDGHAVGNGDGLFSDSGHRCYQTSATTSPPTPCCRASWPVSTPREVETIDVPMPPWTLRMPPAGA